jgi:type 1 glutamine amidotransferase
MNRRNFIQKTAFASALAGIAPAVIANTSPFEEPTIKDKKILFVWGGWDGHEPEECRDIFVPWMKSEGALVEVFNTLDCYTNKDLMENMDLIVQAWTMGEISNEQEQGLLAAVRDKGKGLAGWHGGLGDSFRNNTEYQFMVGGQWVAHPGGIINYNVEIIDHDNYITRGLKNFQMESEQYYMHIDPNNKVLVQTKFNGDHASWIEGAIVPVAWTKNYGQGKVFYSSLGHVASDFSVPEALTIMQRGIRWAAN